MYCPQVPPASPTLPPLDDTDPAFDSQIPLSQVLPSQNPTPTPPAVDVRQEVALLRQEVAQLRKMVETLLADRATSSPTTITTPTPSPLKPSFNAYDLTSSPEMEEFVETSQIIGDRILARRMTRFPSPPLSDKEKLSRARARVRDEIFARELDRRINTVD